MEPEKYVIITAGGSGERMGSDVPKQFLDLCGKPVLRHTIELFLSLSFKVEIILVLNADYQAYWKEYGLRSGFDFKYYLAKGGITRFHSVKNGLKYVPPGSIVAVHDAVRPFISKDRLVEMFQMAQTCDAVIPVLNVVDSLRERDESGKTIVVDRDRYIAVQTPQIFKSDVLIDSYKQAYSPLFTDDASVVEEKGYSLTMVSGDRMNIKITTPDDMTFARAIYQAFPG